MAAIASDLARLDSKSEYCGKRLLNGNFRLVFFRIHGIEVYPVCSRERRYSASFIVDGCCCRSCWCCSCSYCCCCFRCSWFSYLIYACSACSWSIAEGPSITMLRSYMRILRSIISCFRRATSALWWRLVAFVPSCSALWRRLVSRFCAMRHCRGLYRGDTHRLDNTAAHRH